MKLFFGGCILYCFLLTGCTKSETEEHKISGAYEALNELAYQKAYPRKDIPADGYFSAFESMQGQVVPTEHAGEVSDWEPAGPWNIAGRALALAVNPQDPLTIYMGTASGGLWRSRKLGKDTSWHHMPLGHPVLGVSSIAIHPTDSMIMYIGTGEVYNYAGVGEGAAYRNARGTYGIGILKSLDGGKTWDKSLDWSYQNQRGVNALAISPENPNVLYAATSEGAYKTTDGGENWVQVLDVVMAMDVLISPNDINTVFVACGNFNSPGKGIYKSENGGLNFFKINDPSIPTSFEGKIQLAAAPSAGHIIYASIGNGFTGDDGATWLLRSGNNGISWALKSQEDYSKWQGWFAHDIAVHPQRPDEIMAIGIDIFKSTDGGENLEQKTTGGVNFGILPIGLPDGTPTYSHSDHHAVLYHPAHPDTILFANDGGLYLSEDGGETYQSANGGLQTTQFYNGFSVSHENHEYGLGGLQDNSTVIYFGGKAWKRILGGDGSWTAINQRNNDSIYASWQYLNAYLTVNEGLNFEALDVPYGPGDFSVFIAPFIVSEADPKTVYAARTFFFKSENAGLSWTGLNGGLPLNGDPVFAMDGSPTDENVIYVATAPYYDYPAVFASIDGGESFEDISLGLPNRFPTDIHVSKHNEAEVYITFGGFGTGHVFKSVNFGVNWENITANLPDVPTQAIVSDPDMPDKLYVGNDFGVFYSPNGGVEWFSFSEGINDIYQVMDLKISNDNRIIWVATHGKGAYFRPLYDESTAIQATTQEQLDFKIFPNPSSQYISIQTEMDLIIDDVQISDIDGKISHSLIPIAQEKSISKYEIPSAVSDGIYVIKILSERGLFTSKIVVKK